ncbi:MAG: short-chain dehydrogenase [Rhodospirillaceae bacterium TMED167]|nr:MAG: short-chain dehydrogenase [Rhodospirillaceae bacterium TMED167]
MQNDLTDKTAFVTGGSAGIGAATVRMLADAGSTVIVGYNTGENRASSLINTLPGNGHSIQQITMEDSDSIKRATDAIKNRHEKLHVLVNSAGFTKPIPHNDLDALDDEFFDHMLLANVRGPFSVIRELRPLLQISGDSVIVNLSSVSGFKGAGSNIAYCACKAAIDTMTLSLARALGPEIRVNTVSPGAVATDFVAGRDRAKLEELAKHSPLQKVVEPEDVAMAVMAYVTHLKKSTGAQMIVDSGRFL